MKLLTFLTALLFTTSIYAADIVGTEGDDVINGTPQDDNISALGGDDVVNPNCGNDVIDLGTGADTINVICDTAVITGGDGAKTITFFNATGTVNIADGNHQVIVLDGLNPQAAANITVGDGDTLLGLGVNGGNVIAGNGNNTVSAGGDLINEDPTVVSSVTTGSGADTITDSKGTDTFDAGSGNDSLSTIRGDDVLLARDGDDEVLYGTGSAVGWGGAGSDTFVQRVEVLEDGDKEIVDFAFNNEMDFIKFTIPGITAEQIIQSAKIVGNGEGAWSKLKKALYALLMPAQAYASTEPSVAEAQQYQSQRLLGIQNRTTIWEFPNHRPLPRAVREYRSPKVYRYRLEHSNVPVDTRGAEEMFEQLRVACVRATQRTGTQWSLWDALIPKAQANPDPELGDLILTGLNATILIKGGADLIANGQLTLNNLIIEN